jgi:hypothetical protein
MARLIPLQSIRDPRGTLVVMETGRQVPFNMPRLFLLLDMPQGGTRGDHAHRAQHQLLVPVHGALEVETIDRGGTAHYVLEDPAVGLHAPPLTWLKIKALQPGASCLVLTSERFDEADYIRDFAEFERLVGG